MSAAELQVEEREVLSSIYEGDDNFKPISDSIFQYKIGDDGHYKSLLLEISWYEDYPDQLPKISLDAFYNKNITASVKKYIVDTLTEQAESLLGCAMTYTLFEWAKENRNLLMAEQTETVAEQNNDDTLAPEATLVGVKKSKEKKEQLTKSQKRRIINRIDLKTGERPRGWDWVDVVKHLSQTGSASERLPTN